MPNPVERTATKVLMDAMEDFGTAEPDRILVLFNNADGDFCVTSNCSRSEMLGLMEMARIHLIRKMLTEE